MWKLQKMKKSKNKKRVKIWNNQNNHKNSNKIQIKKNLIMKIVILYLINKINFITKNSINYNCNFKND